MMEDSKSGQGSVVTSALRFAQFEPMAWGGRPSGVYALLLRGTVVYVGQSLNVFQRLAAHWNARRGTRKKLSTAFLTPGDMRSIPLEWDQIFVRWATEPELEQLERRFIELFKPTKNVLRPTAVTPEQRISIKDLEEMGFTSWTTKKPWQSSQRGSRILRRKIA